MFKALLVAIFRTTEMSITTASNAFKEILEVHRKTANIVYKIHFLHISSHGVLARLLCTDSSDLYRGRIPDY